MREKQEGEWTLVNKPGNAPGYTQKMKVPGGWLYRTVVIHERSYRSDQQVRENMGVAMCFVPEAPGGAGK